MATLPKNHPHHRQQRPQQQSLAKRNKSVVLHTEGRRQARYQKCEAKYRQNLVAMQQQDEQQQ